MSISLALYLADICGSLVAATIVLAILFAIISLVYFIRMCEEYREEKKPPLRKLAYKYFIAGIIFMFISVVIPSTNTVYQMIAVESINSLGNTPEAAKLRITINKSLDLINSKLDQEENVNE